jgi:hypothetical protein
MATRSPLPPVSAGGVQPRRALAVIANDEKRIYAMQFHPRWSTRPMAASC